MALTSQVSPLGSSTSSETSSYRIAIEPFVKRYGGLVNRQAGDGDSGRVVPEIVKGGRVSHGDRIQRGHRCHGCLSPWRRHIRPPRETGTR